MNNCDTDDVYIPSSAIIDNTTGLGIGLVNPTIGDTTLIKTVNAGPGIMLTLNGAVGAEYVTITSIAGGLSTLQSAYDNSLPGDKIVLNNVNNEVSIINAVGDAISPLFTVNNNASQLLNVANNGIGIFSTEPTSTGNNNIIIGDNNVLNGTNSNSIVIGQNNTLPDLDNTIVFGNGLVNTDYTQDNAIYKNSNIQIDMFGNIDPFNVNSSPSKVKQGFNVVNNNGTSVLVVSLPSDAAFDTAYLLKIDAIGKNPTSTFVAGLTSTHSFGYNSVPQITLNNIISTTNTGINVNYVAPNFEIEISNTTGQNLEWNICIEYMMFRT